MSCRQRYIPVLYDCYLQKQFFSTVFSRNCAQSMLPCWSMRFQRYLPLPHPNFSFFRIVRWSWDSIRLLPYDTLGDATSRFIATLRIIREREPNGSQTWQSMSEVNYEWNECILYQHRSIYVDKAQHAAHSAGRHSFVEHGCISDQTILVRFLASL